ncbi:MAG: 16S rRNA (guanine(527)-N(7))-methyltransferase RsmG [Lachnospiraceae bacterium]|nr:16S rRNA (guanine(527)-N(7))-methyltransferase RsmG [Lachnospiraceae bacterium]
MEYQTERFLSGLEQLNITISEEMLEQFLVFYQMLIEKNKVMNLTAITEFEDVVEKHFLDSLSLAGSIDLNRNYKILDLGTGAGFPGIPLKIVFPELEIVLMDSLNKRVLFLQEVLAELNLKKITAVHGRAEEMARKSEYREQFDLCLSRAVANLSSLSEYCIPFVKQEGMFISYKSGEIEEEVCQAKKAVHLLGGEITKVDKFTIPGTDLFRSFVHVRKKQRTPKAYPRKAGMPAKNPIH